MDTVMDGLPRTPQATTVTTNTLSDSPGSQFNKRTTFIYNSHSVKHLWIISLQRYFLNMRKKISEHHLQDRMKNHQ